MDARETYVCTFDRIGRRRDISPQTFLASDAADLAHVLYHYALPFLGSREVEVHVDLETLRGSIVVGGFRPAGSFRIEVA